MRFVLANEKLTVAGRSYPGFPLLLKVGGEAMQPAQTFLWDYLLKSGRTNSRETWEAYGRAVYDFFGFCYANNIDWQNRPPAGLPGAIEAWRDWSKGDLNLKSSTINQRLRVIVKFYEWALKAGYIDQLPYENISVRLSSEASFLSDSGGRSGRIESPEMMLREEGQKIKFLTKEQIISCHSVLANPSHHILFQLMSRTGMRQIEARTFPLKYVFDPTRRKDLIPGQKIRLHLDPADMKLKYSKHRDIDMPYDLMEELWAYLVRHRQRRERNHKDGKTFPTLLLTEFGNAFSKDSVTKAFDDLAKRVGFDIHPHMLRHTYATYLLWSLRKSKTFQGEPLLYVRDRLGHTDITTTTVYLHLINSLEGHIVLAHEDEIDQIFQAMRSE